MKEFPYVDLSMMLDRQCAVICKSTKHLEVFFLNAKEQLSKYVNWDFNFILNLWSNYCEKNGLHTI